jgi:Tol biopolymer transport system component
MNATGTPFAISETGRNPSLSLDGTLVYLEGASTARLARLVWRDRDGNHLGTIGQSQTSMSYPTLSPDGLKVAVSGEGDIWIHEVDRSVKTNFTTDEAREIWPTWSPSGDRIAFSSRRKGGRTIYTKRADGSGEPTEMVRNPEYWQYFNDWSPDERFVLFVPLSVNRGALDLWYLERKEDGQYEEVPFLQTTSEENAAKFSPDGRFVAYRSDRTEQREVFVCTFPECWNQQRVSINGGSQPRWRKDGKELFYVEGNTLMAVAVSTDPTPTLGLPQKLFSSDSLVRRRGRELNYDVTPDGERFVIAEPVAEGAENSKPVVRVIQNWYEEFRDRE